MTNYQTFEIMPDFKIFIEQEGGDFLLSDVEKIQVEQIWHEEAQLKGDKLFNGRILCYVRHSPHELVGRFVDYKNCIASLRDPLLRNKMAIQNLGISGLTYSDGAILWGKRSSFVTAYAGYYECAPSGGLNPGMVIGGEIPVHIPFQQELHEETGLPKGAIDHIQVTSLLYDKRANLYEIIATIELEAGASKKQLAPTEEYEELLWVDIADLSHFFHKYRGQILETSYFVLTNLELTE